MSKTELENEIERARHDVRTDSYPMSIGEIVNLYLDGEIDIHPNFQRVFRWTNQQKSNLIESIFLGIPLPSIFVSQRDDGIWDVVDGLQRLSTILSYMGKLKDENGNFLEPFPFQETKYLKSLKNAKWESADSTSELPNSLKLLFKRQKIDFKIIQRESSTDTKFELFQRLNTGGSALSDQELRNCILIMVNLNAFNFIEELSQDPNFQACTPITEKKEEQSFYNELVMRFFVQRHFDQSTAAKNSEIHPFLNDSIVQLFSPDSEFDYQKEEKIFKLTFDIANKSLSDDAFRKFNVQKQKHEGAFSLPVFEVLSTWLSKVLDNHDIDNVNIEELTRDFKEKSQSLAENQPFQEATAHGVKAIRRTQSMIDLAIGFINEDRNT